MLLRIGIALLAVGVVAGVVGAIFWDGSDHERTIEYRIVSEDGTAVGGGGGSVVLVSDGGWRGPGFFPFFPLLVVGGVLVTVALLSRRRGGCGPGGFEERHRAAHGDGPTAAA